PHHHGCAAPEAELRVRTALAREDLQPARRPHDGAETTGGNIGVGRHGRAQPDVTDLYHERPRSEASEVFLRQRRHEVAEAIDAQDLPPDEVALALRGGEDEPYRIRDDGSQTL